MSTGTQGGEKKAKNPTEQRFQEVHPPNVDVRKQTCIKCKSNMSPLLLSHPSWFCPYACRK